MAGWLKLYRKLLKWEWYHDTNAKVLFLHLLLTANYEQAQCRGIIVCRGQVLTTIKGLSYELGLSVTQLRTAIRKLSSTGDISVTTSNKYTIITVTNFENYQGDDAKQPEEEQAYQPARSARVDVGKEQQFKDEMMNDKYWQEVICMRFHLKIDTLQQMLSMFWMDATIRVRPHKNIVDAKNHFCNWYMVRLRIEQNDKQSNNEYNNRQQQQLSQRRGFEATASQAQDYEGTF
jgi:hypothetical protein